LAQFEANDVVAAAVDDVAVVEAAAEGTRGRAEGAELGRRIWAAPPPLCGRSATPRTKASVKNFFVISLVERWL